MSGFKSSPPFPSGESPEPRAKCKVCGEHAYLFDVVDFNKYCSDHPYSFGLAGIPVYYYRCYTCGLVYSKFFDKWSSEDFRRFVYNAEYIKVDGAYVDQRPTQMADKLAPYFLERKGVSILDYGGGNGRLTERLREHGICNVESYDPFSNPIKPNQKFDIITCFEVIEHSPFPVDTMIEMKSYLHDTGIILLGTGLQPEDIVHRRASWWYIAPRNGHITIFDETSLARLASTCGLIFYPGSEVHCFSFVDVNPKMNLAVLGVGRPFRCHVLYAPDQLIGSQLSGCWHDVESGEAENYRWTSSRALSWQVPLVSGSRIRIEIPFLMEIEPRFAETSVIMIGAQALPTRVVVGDDFGPRLLVYADIDYVSTTEVILWTPEPIRP